MQPNVKGSVLERAIVPLGLAAILLLSGWYAFAFLIQSGSGQPSGFNAQYYILLAGTIPSGATTFLLVLIGVSIWLARPRRRGLFFAFVTVEAAGFAMTVAAASVFAYGIVDGGRAIAPYIIASIVAVALTLTGLFLLLLLARPQSRTVLPAPGASLGPAGPVPPP